MAAYLNRLLLIERLQLRRKSIDISPTNTPAASLRNEKQCSEQIKLSREHNNQSISGEDSPPSSVNNSSSSSSSNNNNRSNNNNDDDIPFVAPPLDRKENLEPARLLSMSRRRRHAARRHSIDSSGDGDHRHEPDEVTKSRRPIDSPAVKKTAYELIKEAGERAAHNDSRGRKNASLNRPPLAHIHVAPLSCPPPVVLYALAICIITCSACLLQQPNAAVCMAQSITSSASGSHENGAKSSGLSPATGDDFDINNNIIGSGPSSFSAALPLAAWQPKINRRLESSIDWQRITSRLAKQFGGSLSNRDRWVNVPNTPLTRDQYRHPPNRRASQFVRALNGLRNRMGARNTIRVHNAFRDLAWRILSRLSMPTPVIYELRRQNFYSPEEDLMNDSLFNKNTTKSERSKRLLDSLLETSNKLFARQNRRRRAVTDDEDDDEPER